MRREKADPYRVSPSVWRPSLHSTKYRIVGYALLTSLAAFGCTKDVTSLIRDLNPTAVDDIRNHAESRKRAAVALGKTKDPRAVEPLLVAVQDPDVCEEAARALGEIGDARATLPLLKLAREMQVRGEGDGADETSGLEGGRQNQPQSAAYLAIVEAVRRLPLDSLCSSEAIIINAYAVGWFSMNRDPRLVATCVQCLKADDAQKRSSAAHALGQLYDASSVEPLIHAAVQDVDGGVRLAAIQSLGRLQDARAAEPLLALLGKPGDDHMRSMVTWALGLLGDARTVEPLIRLLQQDPSSEVRAEAVRALANLKNARAVPALLAALESRETVVRDAAVEALPLIDDPRAAGAKRNLERQRDAWFRELAQNYFNYVRGAARPAAGTDRTIDDLCEALSRYGTKDMAQNFVNSGNGRLESAGRMWAENHGYVVEQFGAAPKRR